MHSPAPPTPIARRILSDYFLFALAGLFSILCATLMLAWREQLTEAIAAVVVIPMIILLAGGLIIQRKFRLTSQIEAQLLRVAASGDDSALQPIVSSDPLARGWNLLRTRLETQSSWESIESRLRENTGGLREQRMESVLHQLSDGVLVTDSEQQIIFCNAAAASLLKTETDQLLGLSPLSVLNAAFPEAAETLRQKFSAALTRTSIEVQQGAELTDGVVRIGHAPAQLASGAVLHVWTLRDITQRKLAEDTRNKFVYTATHELRTPLTNLKALAETLSLEEQINVEEQKQFCNLINTEATRLARFVDDLLNLSQIETGALSIKPSETDVERLFNEVLTHLKPEIDRKQIHIESSLPAKLPALLIDKDKIAAALVNLVGNAVKYTPAEGCVRLDVQTGEEQMEIYVEDDGYGIAPEELPHVFDKFFRSDDRRVRAESGSGLGLAFTRDVIHMHGGKITVNSELNKGTRFSITLPLSVRKAVHV